MKYIKQFLLMIQFLTRIPIKASLNVDEKDFGKGLALAPLVGLIMGFILYAIYLGASLILPLNAVSVIIVISYIMLSGGIHFDGLGDTFDGVFSGRSKERIMEIMKDSRSGTFGVLSLICVIIFDIVLLNALLSAGAFYVVILFPVVGRMSCIIGAGAFKYARKGGLGKSFVEHCGIRQIIFGLITLCAASYFIGGLNYLILGAISMVTGYLTNLYFSIKLSGVTGDTIGASCELNQTFYLLLVAIMITVIG